MPLRNLKTGQGRRLLVVGIAEYGRRILDSHETDAAEIASIAASLCWGLTLCVRGEFLPVRGEGLLRFLSSDGFWGPLFLILFLWQSLTLTLGSVRQDYLLYHRDSLAWHRLRRFGMVVSVGAWTGCGFLVAAQGLIVATWPFVLLAVLSSWAVWRLSVVCERDKERAFLDQLRQRGQEEARGLERGG